MLVLGGGPGGGTRGGSGPSSRLGAGGRARGASMDSDEERSSTALARDSRSPCACALERLLCARCNDGCLHIFVCQPNGTQPCQQPANMQSVQSANKRNDSMQMIQLQFKRHELRYIIHKRHQVTYSERISPCARNRAINECTCACGRAATVCFRADIEARACEQLLQSGAITSATNHLQHSAPIPGFHLAGAIAATVVLHAARRADHHHWHALQLCHGLGDRGKQQARQRVGGSVPDHQNCAHRSTLEHIVAQSMIDDSSFDSSCPLTSARKMSHLQRGKVAVRFYVSRSPAAGDMGR